MIETSNITATEYKRTKASAFFPVSLNMRLNMSYVSVR